MMRSLPAILTAFLLCGFIAAADTDTLPLSDSERQTEALRSSMTAIMEKFTAVPENKARLEHLLNGRNYKFISGIHTEFPASASDGGIGESDTPVQSGETDITHIKRYYQALNDLTRHFIHAMQPVLRRALFDSLNEGKVTFILPEVIPEPMTELEEFETLERVLKLPPVRLRPILIALGLDPNAFFEMDDDKRFMEFAIAADQKIQRHICALLPDVFPWQTFECTDENGRTAFGVLAVFCPAIRLNAPDTAQEAPVLLPPADCLEWLKPSLACQEGVRPVRGSDDAYHLLGIGRVILHSDGNPPSETRADRLAAIRKRETAVTEARRRAISALQIHLAMTRFFSSEDAIGELLENYRLTGFGNYSFENSLEESFKSLPQFLAAQTPLPESLFTMLLQTEEKTPDGQSAIIVVMGL